MRSGGCAGIGARVCVCACVCACERAAGKFWLRDSANGRRNAGGLACNQRGADGSGAAARGGEEGSCMVRGPGASVVRACARGQWVCSLSQLKQVRSKRRPDSRQAKKEHANDREMREGLNPNNVE